MESRILRVKIILILFILITDLLFYISAADFILGVLLHSTFWFNIIYWTVTGLFTGFILFFKFNPNRREPRIMAGIYRFIGFFMILYFPKIIFILFQFISTIVNLLFRVLIFIINLFPEEHLLYRPFDFITCIAIVLSLILFILLIYGILIGRFQFKTEQVSLRFKNLPASFNNFRIVQISDIHLGSWYRKKKKMEKAVTLINNQNADLIIFTGDLVNNFSEETDGWSKILKEIKARYGKYSILGNHDYGDYWSWKNTEEKQENLQHLFDAHKEMNFNLLRNESALISKNGHRIAIIGVENWGKPPFNQYGNLHQAMKKLKTTPFKILLSHNPSHWSEEVHNKTDIDLTFSGHTHAMQFGIKIGKFQWSPIKYMYRCWSGLYGENGQYLYVNRGLGSIGFPGRVGMRPEITTITLLSNEK